MAVLNPECPWLSLHRLERDCIEKKLWTSAATLEMSGKSANIRFIFKLKMVRFTMFMTTIATKNEKTNLQLAMCKRFLSTWAELLAIMTYVIDNGEIHAGG